MSDRIGVMSVETRGIEQVGSPRDIYERPASARVSTFVGQTNLWEETVASVSEGGARTGRGLALPNDGSLTVGNVFCCRCSPRKSRCFLRTGPSRSRRTWWCCKGACSIRSMSAT